MKQHLTFTAGQPRKFHGYFFKEENTLSQERAILILHFYFKTANQGSEIESIKIYRFSGLSINVAFKCLSMPNNIIC